jgi:hypothetical protein
MSEFKKEDRYLVFKREELNYVLNNVVPTGNAETFNSIVEVVGLYRKSLGKDPLDCVVSKKGTQEYDEVWRIIEQRWHEDQEQLNKQQLIRYKVNIKDG